jgi:hypothetical protein
VNLTEIEEDLENSYADVLLRCFLAEGVAQKHPSIVISADKAPELIIEVARPIPT